MTGGRRITCCYVEEYLSHSSIHGLSHLAAKSVYEKTLWSFLFATALSGVIVITYATLNKYTENPTVITVEKDHYFWNTSFPSATVCPVSKINSALLENYVASSTATNKTLLKEFMASLAYANLGNLDKIPSYDEIPGEVYMQLVLDLQNDFTPVISSSGLGDDRIAVHRVITEMGVCYTFNSKLAVYSSPQYWDQDLWEIVQDHVETLNVSAFDEEVFVSVENVSSAYDVYIHGPYEVADISSKYIRSPNGYFLQLYLSGLTLFSSDSIKSLGVQQRKCRFYYESDLRHSPVYSYVLCRMDCRANLAIKLCGCVPHFYRKLDGEKVCNVDGLHCLAKHKDRLTLLKSECSCLANCDEVNYVVEDTDGREWFLGSNLQWGLKYYPKMRLRRDVIFGFSDLLVYIGGMAGLFLGCSVLSFIEIIYFFTLRLYWFVVKYEKPKASRN
ncbi:hypothetical protein NQ315_011710 [Exocentrus adspersus]|uniref:Sodium channel protein Nach n=1 Tax=Exocentrus adspersus TaxID=1586481 RepID=A0AAV8W0D0_9CUCU|nr:hypothetical protein NQ315_011710 [Exocentrus adspersus]